MSAIFRKIKADLFNRRLATFLVTLTILASSTLLTLTATTLSNMSASFERSFEALKGAHLWLYFDRAVTSRADVARVEELPGVVASTGLQFSQITRVELGAEQVLVSLRQLDTPQPVVNRLRVTAGRYLTLDDTHGVLVDTRLAEQFHVRPNDTIRISTASGYKPVQVVGLALNPTWDTYRTVQPPYLYALDKTFQSLFPDWLAWDWSVGLRLADPNAVKQTLAAAESITRSKAIQDHTDWRDVRDAYLFSTQLNALFLTAFGLFALAAAALIMTNSISGAVLAQFRDIGVLKALGFTGHEVATVYLGQNLAMGAVGGVIGIVIGVALAPLPLTSLARSLNTTLRPAFDPVLLSSVLIGVLSVVLIATLLPARRGARVNTIQAITIGYELPGVKPSRLAWLARAARLPIPIVIGAKDAFARRGRATLTLLSLLLGVVSLVFSFELNAVINTFLRDPSLAGVVYDVWVSRESMSDSTARRTLERAPGVTAMLAHVIAKAETLDGKEFRVRAEEGDLSQFPFKLEAGRLINTEVEGEAMIGLGLQTWLGLSVGDTLRVRVNGYDKRPPAEWRIVGVYREPADNGQMAIVSLRSLHAIDRAAEPDTYFLRLSPGANVEALRAYVKSRAGQSLSLAVVDTQVSGLYQFRLTMLALSVALSAIALISVFNSAVLNMRERMSEVGTYKTIGMTPAQVVEMVLASGGTLGVLAGLLGVPLGVLLVQITLTAVGKSYGFGSFDLRPDWAALILPALVAVGVGLLGSIVPARWAARLNVVQVLQYE
jgi:putative ABC transport system permease protein